jgi:hypothetical protein
VKESQQLLQALVAEKVSWIGQLEIVRLEGGFVLSHRDDAGRNDLREHEIDDAFDIARFDDTGNYRPLKTAPTLRHGWKIFARDLLQVERVIDTIYPGRLPEWNVSHRGKNFRRTDRWPGRRFLPVRRRMFAHNFVETGCQRQRSIVETTAGEIRPGG